MGFACRGAAWVIGPMVETNEGGSIVNLVPKRLLAGAAVVALVASACSSTAATPSTVPSGGGNPTPVASSTHAPVTVNWWHIATGEPGKSIFQGIADAYMAGHPWVTIKITVLENEAFKAKLTTSMQSGQVPDLFQSWGGGGMAQQADAGKLQDITQAISSWSGTVNAGALGIYAYKGKQYGVPWDMGMIGFWYNKAAFTKAGIAAPPATWAEFLTDLPKLRTAGYAPLAIAGKDMWPSMHLWTYIILRMAGYDALQTMIQSGDWNTDACKAAGAEVVKLNALNPYQDGYKSASYDNEAAAVGNGKAAMELMGQWAPGVQMNDSTSKKGLGDDLGWFAFPGIDGGKGDPADGVGGGNGIAVGVNAPPEAIDFLKFFNSQYNAQKIGTPTTAGGSDSMGLSPIQGVDTTVLSAPLQLVLAGRDKAKHIQLYLDQATSSSMGTAINKATVALFLGASTPEKVCQAITDAAAAE
jgi:raffinose/stachyose/melibiose transport system substrate-binding protein